MKASASAGVALTPAVSAADGVSAKVTLSETLSAQPPSSMAMARVETLAFMERPIALGMQSFGRGVLPRSSGKKIRDRLAERRIGDDVHMIAGNFNIARVRQ